MPRLITAIESSEDVKNSFEFIVRIDHHALLHSLYNPYASCGSTDEREAVETEEKALWSRTALLRQLR
jgi:hypothetical protein